MASAAPSRSTSTVYMISSREAATDVTPPIDSSAPTMSPQDLVVVDRNAIRSSRCVTPAFSSDS